MTSPFESAWPLQAGKPRPLFNPLISIVNYWHSKLIDGDKNIRCRLYGGNVEDDGDAGDDDGLSASRGERRYKKARLVF